MLGSFLCLPDAHTLNGFIPSPRSMLRDSGSNRFCLVLQARTFGLSHLSMLRQSHSEGSHSEGDPIGFTLRTRSHPPNPGRAETRPLPQGALPINWPSKLARSVCYREQPGLVPACADILTHPTLAILFHPPDPPIALQSITRDAPFSQASTAKQNLFDPEPFC